MKTYFLLERQRGEGLGHHLCLAEVEQTNKLTLQIMDYMGLGADPLKTLPYLTQINKHNVVHLGIP